MSDKIYKTAKSRRALKAIRMNEDTYYQARVAAVISRKSLGQWIEEAVSEKLRRESINPVLSIKAPEASQTEQESKTEEVGRI